MGGLSLYELPRLSSCGLRDPARAAEVGATKTARFEGTRSRGPC